MCSIDPARSNFPSRIKINSMTSASRPLSLIAPTEAAAECTPARRRKECTMKGHTCWFGSDSRSFFFETVGTKTPRCTCLALFYPKLRAVNCSSRRAEEPAATNTTIPLLSAVATQDITMAMTTEEMVFVFCSNGVFIPWLALMFAPR